MRIRFRGDWWLAGLAGLTALLIAASLIWPRNISPPRAAYADQPAGADEALVLYMGGVAARILPGERIAVIRMDGGAVSVLAVGRLVSARGGSVTVLGPNNKQKLILKSDIQMVVRGAYKRTGPYAGWGTLIGATAGLAVGLAVSSSDDSGYLGACVPIFALGGAAGGAAGGAVVGGIADASATYYAISPGGWAFGEE